MARRRGQRKGYLAEVSGSWLGQWREDFLVDGRIIRRKVAVVIGPAKGPGAVSKREAQRIFWETVLSKLDTISTRPQTMCTLAEFIRTRYEPECVLVRKKSGRRSTQSRLERHIIPELGHLRMRDIGIVEVSRFLTSRLNKGLAPLTVGGIKNILSSIFTYAKRTDHYAGELPTAYVRLPEMTRVKRRGSLTFEQVWALAERQPPRDRALVLFLAITGPRIGEALGLRWGRLNLTGELVSYEGEVAPSRSALIVENYVEGEYGTVKRAASNRILPLPRLLLEALTAHRDSARPTAPDDPVFAGRGAAPLSADAALVRIKKAAAGLGLPRAWSWHWLRHTATSLADQCDMTITERQRGLGHSSASMTMRYSHSDLERVRAGLERVANRMERGRGGDLLEFRPEGGGKKS